MAFSSTMLRSVLDLSLSGAGNVWMYGRTTDSSTQVAAVGYFTGCGRGGRGGTPFGMSLGDVVIVSAATGTTLSSTGKVTLHNVIASTANVLSTLASSGFNAAYDVTLSAGTT